MQPRLKAIELRQLKPFPERFLSLVRGEMETSPALDQSMIPCSVLLCRTYLLELLDAVHLVLVEVDGLDGDGDARAVDGRVQLAELLLRRLKGGLYVSLAGKKGREGARKVNEALG